MSESYEQFVIAVANEIDVSVLADHIDTSEIDWSEIANEALDQDEIADTIENNICFSDLVDQWCADNINATDIITDQMQAMLSDLVGDQVASLNNELLEKERMRWESRLIQIKAMMPKPWWKRLKFW